jgi:DUF2934 family protein
MVPPFDIFIAEKDGHLRWIEAARDLETARARVQILGTAVPGEYLIFSHVRGIESLSRWINMGEIRSSEPTRTDIERRAYQLYLQREKADGGAIEDWIQAEKEVNEDFARNKALQSVSHDHTSLHATPRR